VSEARSSSSGLAALVVGVVSVGAAAILIKQAAAPAFCVALWRLALGGGVLSAFVLRPPWPSKPQLASTAVSAGLLAAHFALWIASLQYTTVTMSVVLVCLQPVFVAAASGVVLGQPLRWSSWVAMVIAVAGAMMLVTAPVASSIAPAPMFGNALAIGGAIAIAGYVLWNKRETERATRRGEAPMPVMEFSAWCTVMAAVLVLPLAWLRGEAWPRHQAWPWLIALALFPQVIGHTALNIALRSLSASLVAGAILLEPVIATSMAVVLLGEPLTPQMIAGGALTLVGVAALARTLRSP
jgi:drug/metabolite transporter (DMT)-like permease